MEKIDIVVRIVELLIAVAASAIITRILTIRERVKQEKAATSKAEEEVKSDQIENIEKMVEKAYKPIIEDLTERIQKLQDKVDRLEGEKDALGERIDELEEENRMLRNIVRELAPESVASRRGLNAKSKARNADGTFAKKVPGDG